MMSKLKLTFFLFLVYIFVCPVYAGNKSIGDSAPRDPFVPLVDMAGKVKSLNDLYRPIDTELPIKIALKGILFGQKQPMAIINDRVYKEGNEIVEGLIIEKINSDNVVLKYHNKILVVDLRKKERK